MKRAVVWLVVAAGCAKPQPEVPTTPTAAYARFEDLLRRGDFDGAYATLSPDSRKAIEARVQGVADASVGVIRNEPKSFIFQRASRPSAAASKISVVEANDSVALLEVTTKSDTQRVKMVKDGPQWFVDVTTVYGKAP